MEQLVLLVSLLLGVDLLRLILLTKRIIMGRAFPRRSCTFAENAFKIAREALLPLHGHVARWGVTDYWRLLLLLLLRRKLCVATSTDVTVNAIRLSWRQQRGAAVA